MGRGQFAHFFSKERSHICSIFIPCGYLLSATKSLPVAVTSGGLENAQSCSFELKLFKFDTTRQD